MQVREGEEKKESLLSMLKRCTPSCAGHDARESQALAGQCSAAPLSFAVLTAPWTQGQAVSGGKASSQD